MPDGNTFGNIRNASDSLGTVLRTSIRGARRRASSAAAFIGGSGVTTTTGFPIAAALGGDHVADEVVGEIVATFGGHHHLVPQTSDSASRTSRRFLTLGTWRC